MLMPSLFAAAAPSTSQTSTLCDISYRWSNKDLMFMYVLIEGGFALSAESSLQLEFNESCLKQQSLFSAKSNCVTVCYKLT